MDKPNKDETKPSWDHINTDLKGALDSWTDLSGKVANKISPEEKQLRDIKNILVTLKDQLKEFSDDTVETVEPTNVEDTKKEEEKKP